MCRPAGSSACHHPHQRNAAELQLPVPFQDLASIKVTCTFQSDAGRRRWERNVAADASNRISQAEAFAQRGQAAPHIQRAGALAEADIGSAQCQPAIQPEAEDTVLTFTVHRFDR